MAKPKTNVQFVRDLMEHSKDRTMSIKRSDRNNFDALLTAARNGNLALLECQDKKTGEYRAVICTVYHCKITPIGHLTSDNSFDLHIPPMQESA